MRISIALALSVLALAPPALADPEPWFVEVGATKGLPAGLAHRNVFVDLDGDRWPDAVLHNQRVFRNVPDPAGGRRFVEAPQALGLTVGKRRPDLLLFADLDDDGDADALVGYSGDPKAVKKTDSGDRTRIFLQHAKGFAPLAPRSATAYLGNTLETLISAAFVDVDRDGRLDLVTGAHYREGGLPYECFPLRLLRAEGPPGRFADVTALKGLTLAREPGRPDSRRPLFGLSIADVNNDGRADILACAYGRQRNLLFVAQPDGRFKEIGIPSRFFGDADTSGTYPDWTKRYFKQKYKVDRKDERPFRANGNTFEAACADVDNDGDIDVFLGEITHGWAGPSSDLSKLLVNLGPKNDLPVLFRREHIAPRSHPDPRRWNQGDLYCGWLDADNDGLLDLLIASGDYPDDQRLRLFRQHPLGTFTDVSKAIGLDWDNSTQVTLADYDRDGDVDILLGNSNMRLPQERRSRPLRVALFENRIGNKNHWLNVQLRGKGAAAGGANRLGLGARITVRCGTWTATREIVGGRGHAGRNDHFEAAFGLGRRTTIDEVRVRWPNKARSTQVFRDVPVDQFVVAEEGASALRVLGPN